MGQVVLLRVVLSMGVVDLICATLQGQVETADYAGFLKIRDIRVSYEKLRKLNKNHCKLLTGKMTEMDKVVSALQNELREAKDMISRLEHQKVEWEREFCSLRCTLKQEEEEERRNADILYENIREKLRRKEDEYKKEVETKQQVELALRMLNTELKATKNQVVEERSDTQWQLSPEQKARVLQDGSLNNHFCKQKELEMAQKKTNSKVSSLVILKYMCRSGSDWCKSTSCGVRRPGESPAAHRFNLSILEL
ncbi:ankyrin repeat domain-containing protein 26-like [Panthera uncia]|uniref:ankyrin repeat domain-containing protein 26-like n=1 Tax=Panthera uncia TaxID=29064 RepID=UPI0020FF918A|nr:ankyrin repeat domain-containing protein 26-like [Panthera uncia]